MEPISRRIFFKHAGTVAVVAGGAAAVPLGLASSAGAAAVASSPSKEAPLTPSEDLRGDEHLVAHVKNARTGEISLFIGQREITLHDRNIAARLVRATR